MNRKKTENYIFESMSAERLPDERVLNKAKSAMSADKTYTPPKIAWKAVLCGAVVIILALAVVLPFVFTGNGIQTNDIPYIPMSEISYEQSDIYSSFADYSGNILAFEDARVTVHYLQSTERVSESEYSVNYSDNFIVEAPYKLESFCLLTYQKKHIGMRETLSNWENNRKWDDELELTVIFPKWEDKLEVNSDYKDLTERFTENGIEVSYKFNKNETVGYAFFSRYGYSYFCKIKTYDEHSFKDHISDLLSIKK